LEKDNSGMKMDGLYPALFSHPANFTGIAWFKASVSTHPPLMPVSSLNSKGRKWK